MITVVTTDGQQHIFKDPMLDEEKAYELITHAVIMGKGFMMSDSTKTIAYAPAGVSRVVIEP